MYYLYDAKELRKLMSWYTDNTEMSITNICKGLIKLDQDGYTDGREAEHLVQWLLAKIDVDTRWMHPETIEQCDYWRYFMPGVKEDEEK